MMCRLSSLTDHSKQHHRHGNKSDVTITNLFESPRNVSTIELHPLTELF